MSPVAPEQAPVPVFPSAPERYSRDEEAQFRRSVQQAITSTAVLASKLTTGRTTVTLGAAATTFAVSKTSIEVTGDGGGNTVATITGGVEGQLLAIQFVDTNVTITDTDAHTANTIDLNAAFTSADDVILLLYFDGTSWYEVSRSVN